MAPVAPVRPVAPVVPVGPVGPCGPVGPGGHDETHDAPRQNCGDVTLPPKTAPPSVPKEPTQSPPDFIWLVAPTLMGVAVLPLGAVAVGPVHAETMAAPRENASASARIFMY